jgi:hypothetical protein
MSRARRVGLALLAACALLATGGRLDARPGALGSGGLAGGPLLWVSPPSALAESPVPSAPVGDTRSAGEGPGLVGAPFLAIGGVLALGLVIAALTSLYVRLSGGTGAPPGGAGSTGR